MKVRTHELISDDRLYTHVVPVFTGLYYLICRLIADKVSFALLMQALMVSDQDMYTHTHTHRCVHTHTHTHTHTRARTRMFTVMCVRMLHECVVLCVCVCVGLWVFNSSKIRLYCDIIIHHDIDGKYFMKITYLNISITIQTQV